MNNDVQADVITHRGNLQGQQLANVAIISWFMEKEQRESRAVKNELMKGPYFMWYIL